MIALSAVLRVPSAYLLCLTFLASSASQAVGALGYEDHESSAAEAAGSSQQGISGALVGTLDDLDLLEGVAATTPAEHGLGSDASSPHDAERVEEDPEPLQRCLSLDARSATATRVRSLRPQAPTTGDVGQSVFRPPRA